MKIEDKLVASVISGLKALYSQEVPEKMVQIQKTKKEFEGHLTLVVFPLMAILFVAGYGCLVWMWQLLFAGPPTGP